MQKKCSKFKMILGVLAMSAFIFGFAGCQNGTNQHDQEKEKTDFTTKLPASKGTDEFAGKKLLNGEYPIYDFTDDGIVIEYYPQSIWNEEEGKYSTVTRKNTKYAYTYNSEEKTISLVARGFYYNDVEYNSVDDYVDAWALDNDSEKYSEEYANLYKKLDKEYYAKRIQKYSYSFDSTGEKVTLKPLLGNNFIDEQVSFPFNKEQDNIRLYYSLEPSFIYISLSSNFGFLSFIGRIIDLTDTEGTIVFTDSTKTDKTTNEGKSISYSFIAGNAKLKYTFTKDSDTQGKLKCSITDFDENLTQYFKEKFSSLNYSDFYGGEEESIPENYNADTFYNDFIELFKGCELTYSPSDDDYTEYTVVYKNTSNNTQN